MKVYIYEYKTCSPLRAHHTNMFKDGFAWCRTAGVQQMNKLEFDKYIKYLKVKKAKCKIFTTSRRVFPCKVF